MLPSSIRLAVLVVAAALLQLALWMAFRWLGLQVHGEIAGAPIPNWYALVGLPLNQVVSIAPAFIVGWFTDRRGPVLGAMVGILASLASWGFRSIPGVWSDWSVSLLLMAPPRHVLASALAAAILGCVSGAAGAFLARRYAA
jgi:hypothetical protein